MTVPLVAAAFFGGNIDKTRRFLHEYGYMPTMISKSHLNRRIHAIEPSPWWALFSLLAEAFKKPSNNPEQTYVVDSLPIPVCDNIRIRRCRLYPAQDYGGAFGGYIPTKRRYFYGLGVHLVTTGAGEPVEFSLAAGSEADVSVFKEDLELDLPEGSTILADKAYTDYDYEDLLEEVGLHLKAQPKKNSKRPMPPCGRSSWARRFAPVHRDGLGRVDQAVFQEDPRGHAARLRIEDRLVLCWPSPSSACRRQLSRTYARTISTEGFLSWCTK
jgi:hypothetical protein